MCAASVIVWAKAPAKTEKPWPGRRLPGDLWGRRDRLECRAWGRAEFVRRALILCCLLFLFAPGALAESCDGSGALTRETYTSRVAEHERRVSLYLPPCYAESDARYPLLLLLHGSNADDRQWSRLGFIRALEKAMRQGDAPPMIVVMPYGGALANQNRFDGISYDAILLDLLEQTQERFRTNGAQAIGGISRGGFWAWHLGLRYPARFVAIGGHSPFFDRDHAAPPYNPLNLARDMDEATRLHLWLDRGTSDYAAAGVEQMRETLKRAQRPHEYHVQPGGEHSEASWRQYMDDYAAFYARAFREPAPEWRRAQAQDGALELWLPAAGFGALLASIDSARLEAVLAGGLDEGLILSESSHSRLGARGIAFHPRTRIVADGQLFYALWRDLRSYTLAPFERLHLRLRPLWLDHKPVIDQLQRYPLAFASEQPNFAPEKLTRVTLSGTTALTRHTSTALDQMGLERAASGIRDYARLADFFQITHEASIAAGCPALHDGVLGGAGSMCMKPSHFPLFDLLGVDVVDLTGNHINDYGVEAFANTLDQFEERGYATVGGGRSLQQARQPLILESNGTRIGWLACNDIGPAYAFATDDDPPAPGSAHCRGAWLRETLPVLAANVDLVLMTVQYREYEAYKPDPRHQSDFRGFAELGADAVIGVSQHLPMTFEFYQTGRGETAFIHYGLGNLFFDQLGWGRQRFFLDTLYIYAGELLAVELYPGFIEDRARPRPLEGEDLLNFLHFMFVQQNAF